MGDARALIGFLERRGQRLAPFQRRFIVGAMAPGMPQGGVSPDRKRLGEVQSLTGELLAAAVDPAGPLFRPGGESVLLASSLWNRRGCASVSCGGSLARRVSGIRTPARGSHARTSRRAPVSVSPVVGRQARLRSRREYPDRGRRRARSLPRARRGADVRRAGDERRQGEHASSSSSAPARRRRPGNWWRSLVDHRRRLPSPPTFRFTTRRLTARGSPSTRSR